VPAEGRILKGIGGFYYVEVEGGKVYECRGRGIFRKDNEKLLVGDKVRISIIDEAASVGSVDELLPRKNRLIRPEAANVDQALLVFAFDRPRPNPVLLDRFLITLRRNDVPCVLIFNKKDLVDENTVNDMLCAYKDAVSDVRALCALEDSFKDTLKEILCGKISLLAGPSGVGKSTILNALCPAAEAATGEISRKLKRGKHTTRHSELFAIEGGGYIMDTPGFTALELTDIEADEVRGEYPEFEPYAAECRFLDCMHIKEPGCKVREAAVSGHIPRLRYDNYCAVYTELNDRKRY